jgi:hypothetical protein
MATRLSLEQADPSSLDELDVRSEGLDYALNVVVVYEDELTWSWAREVCAHVRQLVGKEWLRSLSWKVEELTHPRVLPEAVQAAVGADVIVVSVCAREEMPIDLCVWFDAWLPRRPRRAGALVSLIGLPAQAAGRRPMIPDYLRAVARKGGLDYMPRERKLPAQTADPVSRIEERVHTRTQVLSRFLSKDHGVCRGWGINQ